MKAPIALFVYNRLGHCKQTIETLIANEGCKDSDLFIFSDCYKNESDKEKVEAVREYIDKIASLNYFKSVHIHKSNHNIGLAKSIITNVDRVIRKYGKVIVLEDDVITKPNFLSFMNEALDYYEKDQLIWSIGGFNTIGKAPDGSDLYIAQRICSCSWATWLDRWIKSDWEMSSYKSFKFNIPKRIRFSRYGNDCALMLDEQKAGFINSWAIRFNYSAFENSMYTVYPSDSVAKNIGYDGSGTHCAGQNDSYEIELTEDAIHINMQKLRTPLEEIKNRYHSKFSSPIVYTTIHCLCAILGINIKRIKSILR